jgi:hypothetical protein
MRAPALLAFAFVAALIAAAACSDQGEGEFCDPNNGNNDCQSGLECVPAPGLSPTLTNRDRCCPILPALPTTTACALNTNTVIDASTEVPDAPIGPGPDAEAGSASEAGPAEAAADGPSADAPSDAKGDAVVPTPEAGLEGGADASPE